MNAQIATQALLRSIHFPIPLGYQLYQWRKVLLSSNSQNAPHPQKETQMTPNLLAFVEALSKCTIHEFIGVTYLLAVKYDDTTPFDQFLRILIGAFDKLPALGQQKILSLMPGGEDYESDADLDSNSHSEA